MATRGFEYVSTAMKLFFVRGLALLALAGAGCAVGSAAELRDDLSPTSPPPLELEPGPAPGPAPGPGPGPGPGPDASASAAVDASVADALIPTDAAPGSPCAFTGQLVSFDVGLAMGAQVDLLPSSKAAGLSATALRRGGVVTVASNHAMNASDWPSGAVDVAKHFTFSVTPPPGCALSAASLPLSAVGVGSGAVRFSVNVPSARGNVFPNSV